MDFMERVREREIVFTMDKSDPERIEKLSFIHLVMMKFDAEESKIGWFKAKGNASYLQVTLLFSDWSSLSNAKAHCYQCLDDSGSVTREYKGALRRADPSSSMAEELESRALTHRLD